MPNGTEEELEQEEIIGALQNGSATDDSEPLKRMDTHMSRLFLSREHAYKLIRRRRHPFADMTPLAARRRACEVGFRAGPDRRRIPADCVLTGPRIDFHALRLPDDPDHGIFFPQ